MQETRRGKISVSKGKQIFWTNEFLIYIKSHWELQRLMGTFFARGKERMHANLFLEQQKVEKEKLLTKTCLLCEKAQETCKLRFLSACMARNQQQFFDVTCNVLDISETQPRIRLSCTDKVPKPVDNWTRSVMNTGADAKKKHAGKLDAVKCHETTNGKIWYVRNDVNPWKVFTGSILLYVQNLRT